MAIAFVGYVLPFGQMSFWGATVITNLLSPFPSLVEWVCGGYCVHSPSLKRFFLFHLHFLSSNNPLRNSTNNKIPIFPFHSSKRFLWSHSSSLSIFSSNSFRDLFSLTSR